MLNSKHKQVATWKCNFLTGMNIMLWVVQVVCVSSLLSATRMRSVLIVRAIFLVGWHTKSWKWQNDESFIRINVCMFLYHYDVQISKDPWFCNQYAFSCHFSISMHFFIFHFIFICAWEYNSQSVDKLATRIHEHKLYLLFAASLCWLEWAQSAECGLVSCHQNMSRHWECGLNLSSQLISHWTVQLESFNLIWKIGLLISLSVRFCPELRCSFDD